jgi:hypothetical protein
VTTSETVENDLCVSYFSPLESHCPFHSLPAARHPFCPLLPLFLIFAVIPSQHRQLAIVFPTQYSALRPLLWPRRGSTTALTCARHQVILLLHVPKSISVVTILRLIPSLMHGRQFGKFPPRLCIYLCYSVRRFRECLRSGLLGCWLRQQR